MLRTILQEIFGNEGPSKSKQEGRRKFTAEEKIDYKKKKTAEAVERGYVERKSLLTPTEFEFYNALKQIEFGNMVIMFKVRVADIIATPNGDGFYSAFKQISQKHIDFLLVRERDFAPLVAIELDDFTHVKEKSQVNDSFKDEAFKSAGIPLIRFKVKDRYEAEKIMVPLQELVSKKDARTPTRDMKINYR